MKITPLEIRQKTFEKKSFGGYDKDDVQGFLNSLSLQWERLLDEGKEMRIRLEMADKEVQKLREVESSLYKTLKTAEDTGASIVEQAGKSASLNMREAQIKADAVVKEARWQAKTIVEDAHEEAKKVFNNLQNEVKQLERDYQTTLVLKQNMLSDIKHLAQDLLEKADRSVSRSEPLFQSPSYVAAPKSVAETGQSEDFNRDKTQTKVQNNFFDSL